MVACISTCTPCGAAPGRQTQWLRSKTPEARASVPSARETSLVRFTLSAEEPYIAKARRAVHQQAGVADLATLDVAGTRSSPYRLLAGVTNGT